MPHREALPLPQASALCDTVAAVRVETAMLQARRVLTLCADDLIVGVCDVNHWLRDLSHAVAGSRDGVVELPHRDAGSLQHVVYTLSAVLVWAHSLHGDGSLSTVIPADALHAWAVVEREAGLSGRTAAALGLEVRLDIRPARRQLVAATSSASHLGASSPAGALSLG